MFCSKCGKDITDDSKFCRYCGATFEAEAAETVENKEKLKSVLQRIIHCNFSLKTILLSIAIGIWVIVLQNLGIIPVNQDVRVTNTVDAYIQNRVDANVVNTVDANLQEINGRSDVFFNNPRRGDKDKYYVIPVTVE